MLFRSLESVDAIEIVVFADASHANLPNGGTPGAWSVFAVGNKQLAFIEWMSRMLARITKSPLALETSAMADADDAGWLAKRNL